jgi:hypothetical protein
MAYDCIKIQVIFEIFSKEDYLEQVEEARMAKLDKK